MKSIEKFDIDENFSTIIKIMKKFLDEKKAET